MGRSRYKKQFEVVYKHFDKNQVLIVPFDNLINSTKDTINKVCGFINVQRISTLEELNISSIPKNKSKLPSNRLVVQFSFYALKMGFKSLGKRLLNKYRVEKNTPPIDAGIKLFLENKLKEDISFYNQISKDFNRKLDN
jgi:hypothetical protein